MLTSPKLIAPLQIARGMVLKGYSAEAEIPLGGREIAGPIYTVGHSVHEPGPFMELLHAHDVELLVDVRRYPASRRVPQFNSRPLAQTLESGGVAYEHVEELGGRRSPVPDSPNGAWRNDQFRGYADHMATPEFRAALERLLGEKRRLAVMCAEARWTSCHRRLIADCLTARGREVLHIGSRGGLERHELTDFAVVQGDELTYPPAQETLGI
jgi:uncharacterized protein (DUF488 family)